MGNPWQNWVVLGTPQNRTRCTHCRCVDAQQPVWYEHLDICSLLQFSCLSFSLSVRLAVCLLSIFLIYRYIWRRVLQLNLLILDVFKFQKSEQVFHDQFRSIYKNQPAYFDIEKGLIILNNVLSSLMASYPSFPISSL